MRSLKLSLIALGLLSLTSCQKTNDLQVTEWIKGSTPPPSSFSDPQFKVQERSLPVLDESVSLNPQRWGPARVENGYLHQVKDKNGELIYGRMQQQIPANQQALLNTQELQKLHDRRYAFFVEASNIHPEIKSQELVSDIEVVVIPGRTKPLATYAFDLLSQKTESVDRWYLRPDYSFLKKSKVSREFEHPAYIYDAQKMNGLQKVLFQNLIQSDHLENSRIRARTQAPPGAKTAEGPFQFPPTDPKFHQVQAFSFVQQALQFFDEQLSVRLPVRIEIETSMGHPQKTNAAFTYSNQIRLGTGDGIIYENIPNDPSIVIHEVCHILIDSIAHLSTQGEGGSLNEGFADFFTASYLNSPLMGSFAYKQGAKRNLEIAIPYSARKGGLYHDSQIVSSTLWRLRQQLGTDLTQKLALKTLTRLALAQSLSDFSHSIRLAGQDLLSDSQKVTLEKTLQEFAWPE